MKKIVSIFIVLFIIFTACHKTNKTVTSNVIAARNSNIMPSVQNGMLVFSSKNQYEEYIKYLNDSIISIYPTDSTANANDTTDADDRLDTLEMQMPYTSLRKVINQNFEQLNVVGWVNTADIPEDFYIHDLALRSTYNANGDVQVGNIICHLFDADHSILITDGNLNTLTRAHNLTTVDATNLGNIFACDTNVVIYDRRTSVHDCDNYETGKFSHKATADTTWKVNFQVNYAGGVGCNPNHTYSINFISLFSPTIPSETLYHNGDKIDIYVNWGDGTAQLFNDLVIHVHPTSSGSGSGSVLTIDWPNNYLYTPVPNHSYASDGSYNIQVAAKRDYQPLQVATTEKTLNVPFHDGCNWVRKSVGSVWGYSPDGGQAYSCFLHTDNHWYTGRSYFEAETKGYIKSGGNWHHKKVQRLCAQIWFDRFDVNACNIVKASNSAADWPWNAKTATAKVGGILVGESAYNTIYSNHRLSFDGTWYEINLVMYACP